MGFMLLCLSLVLLSILSTIPRTDEHFDYFPTSGLDPSIEKTENLVPNYGPGILYPGSRSNHAMTMDQTTGIFWLFGGVIWGIKNDLWSYVANQWILHSEDHISTGEAGQLCPVAFPGGRYDSHLVGLEGTTPRRLRLFGGLGSAVGGSSGSLNDVWDYYPEREQGTGWSYRSILAGSETWTNEHDSFNASENGAIYPSGRSGSVVWAIGDDLYVFGGDEGVVLAKTEFLWIFRDVSGSWEYRGTNPGAENPPRSKHAAGWKYFDPIDGWILYCFGGDPYNNSLHKYAVSENRWNAVFVPPSMTENRVIEPYFPSPRYGAAVVVVHMSELFAKTESFVLLLAGESPDGEMADVWKISFLNESAPFAPVPVTLTGEELVPEAPGSFVNDSYFRARLYLHCGRHQRDVLCFGGKYGKPFSKLLAGMWKMRLPCSSGGFGEKCELFECVDGVLVNQTDVCSGHGTCYYPGSDCDCESGWEGSMCELFRCAEGSFYNDDLACSGHGTCVHPGGLCICESDWVGEECQIGCSGHGIDVELRTGDYCQCASPYYGQTCGEFLPAPDPVLRHMDDEKFSIMVQYEFNASMIPSTERNLFNCTERLLAETNWVGGAALCKFEVNPLSGFTETVNITLFNYSSPLAFEDRRYPRVLRLRFHLLPLTVGASVEIIVFVTTTPRKCDGKLYSSADVCSGRGDCVAEDSCLCHKDFFVGVECESLVCQGRNQSDRLVCSGHGACKTQNNRVPECACDSAYLGDSCDRKILEGVPPSIPVLASILGIALVIILLLVVVCAVGCVCWYRQSRKLMQNVGGPPRNVQEEDESSASLEDIQFEDHSTLAHAQAEERRSGDLSRATGRMEDRSDPPSAPAPAPAPAPSRLGEEDGSLKYRVPSAFSELEEEEREHGMRRKRPILDDTVSGDEDRGGTVSPPKDEEQEETTAERSARRRKRPLPPSIPPLEDDLDSYGTDELDSETSEGLFDGLPESDDSPMDSSSEDDQGEDSISHDSTELLESLDELLSSNDSSLSDDSVDVLSEELESPQLLPGATIEEAA